MAFIMSQEAMDYSKGTGVSAAVGPSAATIKMRALRQSGWE